MRQDNTEAIKHLIAAQQAGSQALHMRLAAIAESQGKLLERMGEIDEHLRTAFDYTAEKQNALSGQIAGGFGGCARELAKVHARLIEIRIATNLQWHPAKPRKKARSGRKVR